MSQRQDKYIAQLLRANRETVLRHYRAERADDMRRDYAHHSDYGAAQRALRDARDRTLLDLAEARNVAHVEWESDSEPYDFGDCLNRKEYERLNAKLDSGIATVECMFVYVRDKAGSWEQTDVLGSCWIEGDEDRASTEMDYVDMCPVRGALYRHRARDDFGEFSQIWVEGHYELE